MRIRNFIGGHDARAERRIRVLSLGVDPLAGTAAVARAHVDHHAVAEDVRQRIGFSDPFGLRADDHRQFHFPVELLRDGLVVLDGVAGADHRRRRLREDDRLLGQLLVGIERAARLGNVLDVVQADAEDVLARTRDRRKQLDVLDWQRGADRPVALERFQQLGGRLHGLRAEVDEVQHGGRQLFADARSEQGEIDNGGPDKSAQTGSSTDITAIGHETHGFLQKFIKGDRKGSERG